jgi:hypothetical protein
MTKLVKSILSDNLYKKHTRVKKYKLLTSILKYHLLFKNKDRKSYMKFNIGFNKKGDY